ncbi:unnamed protein product [Clonostachys byssicola]|uniref:F-box domain-containing protein n=1 Tax=Clonostachys byssicola TaxID=160290 RepID=A0A9N9UT11_9HYPO|nr:unnamed protein product [Clonostachys byssicola]
MARFAHVPTEIIDRILCFIPRSGLPNLCLVNQSLRQSAERFLYSTIILHWDYSDIPPIILLLRTLLQRPELFTYVHTITFLGDDFDDGTPPLPDIAEIPFEQFIPAIEKTQVPYTKLWIDRLKTGNMEALVGLLIANLSRTRRLALNHGFINGCSLVGKVIQSKVFGGGQLLAFEQLEDVRYIKEFDYSFPENNSTFTDVLSLFYLPTVTHISAWIPNPTTFSWPAGEPNLDHLTSLDIDWLCESFMAKILALTRNLKSLSWTWECYSELDDVDPWKTSTLDLDAIIAVLSHVKRTLERLQFLLEIGEASLIDDEPKMTVLGSFSNLVHFNRLTHIDVPFVTLADFGPDALPLERYLPDSVEVLSLSTGMLVHDAVKWYTNDFDRGNGDDADDYFVQMIQSLAAVYPTRLPRLRHINIVDEHCCFQNGNLATLTKGLALGFDVQITDRCGWFDQRESFEYQTPAVWEQDSLEEPS